MTFLKMFKKMVRNRNSNMIIRDEDFTKQRFIGVCNKIYF